MSIQRKVITMVFIGDFEDFEVDWSTYRPMTPDEIATHRTKRVFTADGRGWLNLNFAIGMMDQWKRDHCVQQLHQLSRYNR